MAELCGKPIAGARSTIRIDLSGYGDGAIYVPDAAPFGFAPDGSSSDDWIVRTYDASAPGGDDDHKNDK